MKYSLKILLAASILVVSITACKKQVNPFFANGTAVTLSTNQTAISPTPADSLSTVLTLNWTNPGYATDSANQKFIVEMDSSGRNFAHEVTFEVDGSLTASFTAKQINDALLSWGFAFGQAYPVDFRITSSYKNNNEQYVSNVITLQITPYVVPPKVVPPSSKTLFLVGDATAGGWGNPVPVPAEEFTRLDSVTYEGTFFLNGGKQYLLLPVDGDWSHKYSVADNSITGLSAGGSFGADLSSNFPGPAVTGMYTIKVDFQHGIFTVTQVSQYGLLYVPGDYQGWTPATAPTLGSPNNDGNYEGYVNIPTGGTYQFKLTTTPDWSNALGDGGGGTLSASGGNLTVPGGGYYHIVANTVNNTWSATATTWSMIGSFSASGWSNDIDMTYDPGNNDWTGTITTVAGDQFKFRANHDWGLNYGDTHADGSLDPGGDNINIGAGTHTITLYLDNPGYYTYKIE